MLKLTRAREDEHGATAIMVAMMMFLLLGMAALVIDIGFGMNERRQDQTAADVSVMAGILESASSPAAVIAKVQQYSDDNLQAPISAADWASCTDPDMDSFGFDFEPLDATVTNCISAAQSGKYLRVRVPDQTTDTYFGKILGVDTLTTSAAAIGKLGPADEEGGIFPFGLVAGTGTGFNCLRTTNNGLVIPPCTAASTGDFYTIDSPFLGNPDFGTTQRCIGQNALKYRNNIAAGLDHTVIAINPADPDPRPDDCPAPGKLAPNQLYTQDGNGPDLDRGLWKDTAFSDGLPARLKRSSNTRAVQSGNPAATNTHQLDDKPLWDYLAGGCAGPITGTIEQKTVLMDTCLKTGNPTFLSTITESPRLVWVPKFTGGWPLPSQPKLVTIASIEPIFLHSIAFNCSSGPMPPCGLIFYPGAGGPSPLCDSGGCNRQLNSDMLTSFVLDKNMLPANALPGGGPGGSLNFSDVTLFR